MPAQLPSETLKKLILKIPAKRVQMTEAGHRGQLCDW
jgi:hypothetical protein